MTDKLRKWAAALGAVLFIIVPGSTFIVAGWIWLKTRFTSKPTE